MDVEVDHPQNLSVDAMTGQIGKHMGEQQLTAGFRRESSNSQLDFAGEAFKVQLSATALSVAMRLGASRAFGEVAHGLSSEILSRRL
ncbi:MAG: hypothetical protein LC777_18815 [Actinobacteria bacterium]|nr:hypothetical protein [Actinomycetota bacterium]